MSGTSLSEMAEFIHGNLRLKTFPVAAKFVKNVSDFPEKTRRPSVALGKKVTICQGVTMARNYGWTVGLARDDLICVPAMIAFGFSDSSDPADSLGQLFAEVKFSKAPDLAHKETRSMYQFQKGEIEGIVLAPLGRAGFEPDTIILYGNPAQIMRLAQAWSYMKGERVAGHFGGKVECDEYLIGPFKSQAPRVVNPGNGERLFAGTQDDELAFAIPGSSLADLVQGLKEAGKPIGARYPVTPYQNFQPEFPDTYKVLGKGLGID